MAGDIVEDCVVFAHMWPGPDVVLPVPASRFREGVGCLRSGLNDIDGGWVVGCRVRLLTAVVAIAIHHLRERWLTYDEGSSVFGLERDHVEFRLLQHLVWGAIIAKADYKKRLRPDLIVAQKEQQRVGLERRLSNGR